MPNDPSDQTPWQRETPAETRAAIIRIRAHFSAAKEQMAREKIEDNLVAQLDSFKVTPAESSPDGVQIELSSTSGESVVIEMPLLTLQSLTQQAESLFTKPQPRTASPMKE